MKEKLIKTVISDNETCRIDIMRKPTGYFELHKYVGRYDEEEDVSYEIRETPNPSGLFDDLNAATEEAKRVLKDKVVLKKSIQITKPAE
jgi:hypothetical protein